MRITLSITNSEPQADDQDLLSLEVYPEMSVDTLRSSVQAETGYHPSAQHLYHNGQLITDNTKTLEQLQINDGDMMALHVRDMRGSSHVAPGAAAGRGAQQASAAASGSSQQRGGGRSEAERDPELIRLQILGDPNMRAELSQQAPDLAAVLEDPRRFAEIFAHRYDRERRERAERVRQIQLLNADPFDVEAQAKIEEMIRQERVTENLQNAMEHNPEVFGQVHMLYLDVEVNGYKFKALVDSGAQTTIMSPSCAEACGIMRLVDKRFAGVARGVGTANIIGRVHSAQIKIGSLFLPCSFTVMEGKAVELLLGLDMLKRHQASIDLAKDKLIIQGVEVPFLGPADLPKEVEDAYQTEPKVPGPAGTVIGQRSGAVTVPSGSGGAAAAPPASAPAAAAAAAQPGPSSSSSSAAPAAAAAPERPPFPREHIEQLMAIGASEEKAIRALDATGGNVEYAASLIFEQ